MAGCEKVGRQCWRRRHLVHGRRRVQEGREHFAPWTAAAAVIARPRSRLLAIPTVEPRGIEPLTSCYAVGLAVIASVYIGFAVADGRPRVIGRRGDHRRPRSTEAARVRPSGQVLTLTPRISVNRVGVIRMEIRGGRPGHHMATVGGDCALSGAAAALGSSGSGDLQAQNARVLQGPAERDPCGAEGAFRGAGRRAGRVGQGRRRQEEQDDRAVRGARREGEHVPQQGLRSGRRRDVHALGPDEGRQRRSCSTRIS